VSQIQSKFIANGAVTNAKVATGIDAAKIGDGSISNTEFQRLNGLTGDIQTQLDAKIASTEKGAANGVATLDGSGKVPVSQLPNAIMAYQGLWNASTNTPTLADGTGSPGDVYRVGTAGTQDLGSGGISFDVGDYVIYNGASWDKADTTDAVSSVNSLTGDVVLDTDDIAEGTANLYYTDARVAAKVKDLHTASPTVTLAPTDLLIVADVSDSNNLKRVTAQDIANLAAPSVSFAKETFTLSAGDITNQYVTLANSPKANSVTLIIKGGAPTLEGALHDFTVSGSQVNFENDLATGGLAALVAGDILQIAYAY
jgi:hypothetical protein